jgi:lysyl oxidase
MRSRILAAGLAVVTVVATGWTVLRSPAAAQSGTVPCTDPRGCPDLTLRKNGLSSAHIDKATFAQTDCAVVEGMTKAGARELLVFPYTTPNLGPGALIVGSPADHPELFEFAPCHNHYHFREYADYRLWTPQGYDKFRTYRQKNPNATAAQILSGDPWLRTQLVEGFKRGFCLLDYKPASGTIGKRDPKKYVTCNNQGIGVGWADEYVSKLDGQWVDVTEVPDGNYVLEVEANAERVFIEANGNYGNNSDAVPVVVKHSKK